MEYNTTTQSSVMFCRFWLLSITIILCFLHASGTDGMTYVTFNNGKVYVFPDSCLADMTTTGNTISFTALDGNVFTYFTSQITSVSQTPAKELPTVTSFVFNKKLNYQVIADAEGAITDNEITTQVAGIGKRLTATFELSDDEAVLSADGEVMKSKSSRLRYETTRILTAGYPGDRILAPADSGRYALKPYGRDYAVTVTFLTDLATAVPRIDINTVGGVNITSKKTYVDAEIIINGNGVFPSMTDSVQIKGRGNTSWSNNPNSKNPYRLKFASKVKPLGLAKGKNWVLLANKLEGSMLTNAYGMKAASLIGTAAANHIIPVDLYINGRYKGSYNFTEKVGLAGNSVDIDNEDAAALLELDTYYDETAEQKFRSSPYNLPVNIKDPEFAQDPTLLTLSDIQQRFNSFVSTVSTGRELSSQVDIDYLARFLMVNEFICNWELFHPKSTYCYNENILDENSKFIFGPVWDLDWAFGYDGEKRSSYFKNNIRTNYYTASANMTQNAFFRTMRNDAKVGRRLYELWRDFMKNDLDELCEYCGDYYQYARPSLQNNKAAAVDLTDYDDQMVRAIDWFRQRASFIYERIRQEQVIPGDLDDDGRISIADTMILIDYLIYNDPAILGDMIADLDEDGEVTIADLVTLIDILLEVR